VLPILAIGGVVGVLLASFAVRAFVSGAPAGLPRVENVELNALVLAMSVGVLLIGGIASSIVPATQAARADFTSVTKESSRSSAGGRRQGRLRNTLVVAQIALALPLLAGSGLLVRSFSKLMNVNSGIRSNGVLSVLLAVPRAKFPLDAQVSAFETQIVDGLRAIPGLSSVGMVNRLPLGNVGQVGATEFDVGAKPLDLTTDWRSATPDYFATMGIPLVRGRLFSMQDDAARPPVGVIDEQLARAVWPGENPIGKRFRIRGTLAWSEIVGVVGHVRNDALDADPRGQVYWNYLQRAQDRMAIVVRSRGDLATLVTPVTQAIRRVDRDQAVYDVRTMQTVVDRSLSQRKLTLVLLVVFGGAALILASVGVYGVVAFGVTQRLREFGIRVALGADRAAVTALVVRQGATMAISGTLVGLTAAIILAGTMRTLLFETEARDPLVLVLAASALVIVAAIASYLPARRAAGVDPAVTLRAE
jgi:predicted permease